MTPHLASTRPASVIVVTGTDTDAGKTVATAAIAAALGAGRGLRIAVDKPTQTGVRAGEPGDVDEVARLVGPRLTRSEGIRLTAAMAPVPAAALEGRRLPSLDDHARRIRDLAAAHDRVLVEGAGGLLVQLTDRRETIAELVHAVGDLAGPVTIVVVCRARLGTLNHTELTLEALATRGLVPAGLVIGSWPADPGPVELSNREHLGRLGVPLLGRIPAGAAKLPPATFRALAPTWLALEPGYNLARVATSKVILMHGPHREPSS
jgi:dethiobiotin synthase